MQQPLRDRFIANVEMSTDDTVCWNWKASLNSNGYGQIGDKGRNRIASQVAWELANGPIPKGLSVLHKCDNPKCCNPSHLFLGTQRDNMLDAIAKGRMPHIVRMHTAGDDHPLTKYKMAFREMVIREYVPHRITAPMLSKKYGVSVAVINGWIHGRRHLKDYVRPKGVLTASDAMQIRQLYATGNYTHKALGERFRVTKSCISPILQGRHWKNIKL